MARTSRSSRGGRGSGRGRSSEGRSSRGRGSSRGGSRGNSRGRSGGDADFMKVGDLTLTKKASDNEEAILDSLVAGIEDGLPLIEVLQQSGLQMRLKFYWSEDGAIEFQSGDEILVSFKEPHEKAPDFLLASASFDKNS